MTQSSQGFTLIEVIIFIVIMGILASTILLALQSSIQGMPPIHYNLISQNLASQCMEGFIAEKRYLGYNNSKLAVASPVATGNLPSTCTTNIPAGFTVSASIASTSLNTDPAYKTVQVTISGLDNLSLSMLMASY